MSRRVVITGLGAVSPLGGDAPTAWAAALAGRSGVGRISLWDASTWPVQINGEVRGFSPDALLGREARRYERFTWFALAAAREAVRDAGLPEAAPLGDGAGVYLGSGIGGAQAIARNAVQLAAEGPRHLSPSFVPQSLTNMAAGAVAMAHGATGPSLCVATACATGNHSIGEAWRAIRDGDAELILAGGAEGAMFDLGLGGFMAMKALSKRNDAPEKASRPFDRARDGFVMAEGAGVLVLEELGAAKARGARIYAEVLGYALNNDAHHITAPPAGHAGAARCMARALEKAGLQPEDVDYVNAHGTSTKANDAEESRAIRAVFGRHADHLAVSSTKSMTGHMLGAAGGIEAIFCALALRDQVMPPTINLDAPDEGCDLDYVPHQAKERRLRVVMSNAFGFGGTNAVVIFGAPPA